MKTARWLILAICVLGPQFALGQYENGVPPVFLPEATAVPRTVSNIKSENLVSSSPVSQILQHGAADNSTLGGCGGCGCGTSSGCNGSCNDFGLFCDADGSNLLQSGTNRRSRPSVGTSFFRNRRGRGGNSGSSKFNLSVNRGPQVCDQCGIDNRTFLQRLLPVSINVRSNHESRYTSFFGGYHNLQDIRSADRLIDFDDSFVLGFARGRRFCNRIRLEREFAIRNAPSANYIEGVAAGEDFLPSATFEATDGLFAFSSMRNLLIDFNGVGSRFKPYVGFGLGGVAVTGDIINDTIGRADWINDAAFAYQLIFGATRKIDQRSEIYAEFRHLGTSGLELENDAGDPTTDFAFQNNTIVFGFRLNRPARTCCGN